MSAGRLIGRCLVFSGLVHCISMSLGRLEGAILDDSMA